MKVFITGAAGFIGSHLCERLLSKGHFVVGVDNFDPFYDRRFKEDNLRKARANPSFTFHETDILDCNALWQLMEDCGPEGPDVVVHLAALAGVRPSLNHPERYQRVNVEGTLNVLKEMRRAACQKLVFASSSSVYGAQSTVPFDERDPCAHPISPYAATKRAGELLCYTFSHLYNMDTTCLRYFTVFGPRQRPEMAIAKFTQAVARQQPITLFGDGSSARDYTFIDDIIDGTMAAIENDLPGFRIYNLGGSRTATLLELVETIEKAVGKKAKKIFERDQPGDVPITYANVKRAGAELGYAPTIQLDEGVARYVEWAAAKGRLSQ
jgi:UDP-glucuronate 4-epimerase